MKKAIGQLGHKKVILKSDSELAILALKEAVRKESEIEIALEEAPGGEETGWRRTRWKKRRARFEYSRTHWRAGAGEGLTGSIRQYLGR